MFDNCKNCLFYDREYDEIEQENDDIELLVDPNPNPHFCRAWKQGIPKDIWEHRTKCPHYINEITTNN